MTRSAACFAFLALAGCTISMDDVGDSGPVESTAKTVERGKAEFVRTVLRMDAGELKVKGGAAKLLEAGFRTRHAPEVTYEDKGARGILEIRGSKKGSWRGGDNTWDLRFDSQTPLDLEVHLGAGETDLDLSKVALRSLNVHMGVGELRLNLDGDYQRDVDVEVHGGVGRAEIRLPRRMGALVDAKGGLGSLDVKGLKQDNGRYVNAAYDGSKKQVRCKVRGGIGEIALIGDPE